MSREGVIGRKVTCDRQRHIVTGIGFSDAWPCFGLKLRVHHVTGRFHEWPGLVKVEKRSKSMRGGDGYLYEKYRRSDDERTWSYHETTSYNPQE